MSEIRSEKKGNCTVTVVPFDAAMLRVEAAEKLRSIAGEPDKPVKAAIGRAAKRVSRWLTSPMSDTRAEDIWRLEAKRIHAEEIDAIRAAAADAQRREEAAKLDQLKDIFATAAERLRQSDPDFHRDSIAVLERAVGVLGAVDRAVARED